MSDYLYSKEREVLVLTSSLLYLPSEQMVVKAHVFFLKIYPLTYSLLTDHETLKNYDASMLEI